MSTALVEDFHPMLRNGKEPEKHVLAQSYFLTKKPGIRSRHLKDVQAIVAVAREQHVLVGNDTSDIYRGRICGRAGTEPECDLMRR